MDLVNYEDQLPNDWRRAVEVAPPSRYGSSACPNSPNPCYCTGKCAINQVYGPGVNHMPRIPDAISEEHRVKMEEILGRKLLPITDDMRKAVQEALNKEREENSPAKPVFVAEHNAEQEEDKLESQQILQEAKEEAVFYPLWQVLDGLEGILRYKNKAYGNSGLSEVGVLSKSSALEKLLARADDKIARIQNSNVLRKNDVCDLMGYLVLICAKQGWNNFDDQKD